VKNMIGDVVRAAAMIVLVIPANGQASAQSRPDASSRADSLVGAWTLNDELSDKRNDRTTNTDSGRRGSGFGRRGGGSGRGGGGGFGQGGGAGRSGRGDIEEMRRARDAMRAIMEAPGRLTITHTESLVIITSDDGRTTRLSPDGKKIEDESTGIGRKTKWDGDKLVSEITGARQGKITETYSLNREQHRLIVTLLVRSHGFAATKHPGWERCRGAAGSSACGPHDRGHQLLEDFPGGSRADPFHTELRQRHGVQLIGADGIMRNRFARRTSTIVRKVLSRLRDVASGFSPITGGS
jgi:hypothetical protein